MTDTITDNRTPTGQPLTGPPHEATSARRSRRRASGRDRRHLTPGRPRQVKIRYTDDEYATLADAARLAGLTPTGYAAEAALATARDMTPPSTAPWRLALVELMAARGQVRRFGSNVNQAARALNALGEAPEWLASAVAITERAVTRLDEAAATVAVVARADRTGGKRRSAFATGARPCQSPDTSRASRAAVGQPSEADGRMLADSHGSLLAGRGRVRPAAGADGEGAA